MILKTIFAKRVKERIGRKNLKTKKNISENKDAISLAVGDPNFITPQYIINAAKKALDEGYTHYTMVTGLKELKEDISIKLKEENKIEANPASEVIVTAGGTAAIFGTIQSFIETDDEVIVADPTYYNFLSCIRYSGGIPVKILLDEENAFRLNPEKINEAITHKTKMILINSPNNPTGAVLTKADLKAIADIAIDNDLLVFSDEVYEKIIFDKNKHYSIASFPEMKSRTITLNSFSKTYAMTGFRIGYITGDKDLVETIGNVITGVTLCPNSIAQKAALEALRNKKASKKWLKKMKKEYQKRRDLLVEKLNNIYRIKCIKPAGALFTFPNIKSFKMTSDDFVRMLWKKGHIKIDSGTLFGNGGEGYCRITFAYSQETLRKGINRIQKTLQTIYS